MIAIPHPTVRSVVVSIALCATLPVLSQVSIGNRAGASWSRFTFSSTNAPPTLMDQLNDKAKALLGFTAGLPVEIRFADSFALQPELGYLQQGWVTSSDIEENQLRLNYGQVNVLAKVTIGRRRLRVFVQAGPSWNKLLSARELTRSLGTDRLISDVTVNKDLDPLNPSTWSVMAGGGLAFHTGGAQLFLDYRYVHGVTEPMKDISMVDAIGIVVRGIKPQTNAHLVTLGILVPLKLAGAAPVVEQHP